jgi:hypothetical protein
MRERRGLVQFAGVSMVFRRHTEAIRFKAPVRVVMTVVAAIARLVGVRALPDAGALSRAPTAGAE